MTFLLALFFLPTWAQAGDQVLAFQIFTNSPGSAQAIPPGPTELHRAVDELRRKINKVPAPGRRLGFVLGPISFDQSEEELRKLLAAAFATAKDTGVAMGLHVDDSMFWGREKQLAEATEWLDWKGTRTSGRRLDWSEKPTKILPQLCVNHPLVKAAVEKRANFLGEEIQKGLKTLPKELFLGVIAGWETQLGRDFDTGKALGYCALTQAGQSEKSAGDMDQARVKIVADFVGLWAKALKRAGAGPVYSHVAFFSEAMFKKNTTSTLHVKSSAPPRSYLEATNFSPPSTAFCPDCIPGLSTYPQPGHLDAWKEELKKHKNPAWISAEGGAIDPGNLAQPYDMESYLAKLFNGGAVLVNIFGWGVGESGNPFRKAAEGEKALEAYRKFLSGAQLTVRKDPPTLPEKIEAMHKLLPAWVAKHGPATVEPLTKELERAIQANNFPEANRLVDEILKKIGE